MNKEQTYLAEAVALARSNIENGGRPFGAVVVKDGEIVGRGVNEMLATGDPTSHAELNALRAAARTLRSPRLQGAAVYASGQPCPMCLAAMRMAGITEIAYAHSNADAEPFGLSTAAVYAELAKPLDAQAMRFRHVPAEETDPTSLYATWQQRQGQSEG
ncbi:MULTISPECIES: nucleoside deaminase [unclassified Ensifer]|uniref:nucleoside deaminase n=1 Tax=unclassified Ensifer TaxID=2633371 RepID=UPI000813779F|nr:MULTISPECIES: nucleoside deaminase [unclassified Ensifer]OCO98366.1 tRNA-specific adenosine deaminase [Ensifer sp. LC13]OCP05246.1 tRNA-specific adenosine deaminase [Ensifer sp. LC14]OCP14596.1 tRNA-specific adenosine deaminase [Ensifer sp. LC11]OCP29259.1 tRNA-specific adenosine deaminase [Ensifer sp. LC499]